MAIEFNSHETKYGFFSNFYPCAVEYNGMRFKSAEEELIEKTWWHDTYWGIYDCERCRYRGRGKNKLGELLMELRAYFNGGN